MLIRQTLLYLPAQLIGPSFTFASVLVWTHLLDPRMLGLFALVTATQELSHVVLMSWFSAWTLRYLAPFKDGADARRYLDTEAPIMVAAAVGAALSGALVLTIVGNGPHAISLFAAAATYVGTRTITSHLGDRARSQADVLSYSILSITGPSLGLALGVALALFVSRDAVAPLAGLAAAQVLAILVVLPRVGTGRLFGPIDRSHLNAALRYGLPLMASGPLIWLSVNGVRFLTEFVMGSAAVGLMTVGWALGHRGAAVASMATTAAAFPLAIRRAREHGNEEGRRQLARNGTLLFLLLAPAMGGLYAVGPDIVGLMIAAPYREATLSVLPFAAAAGLLLNLRVHFASQVFLLAEAPRVAVAVDLIDTIASTLLALVGLVLWGMQGAVAGAAAGALAGLMAGIVLGRRSYGLLLPLADLVPIAAASIVMIALVKLLPLGTGTGATLSIRVAFGVVVYLAALLVLRPQLLTDARRALDGAPGEDSRPVS